MAATLPAAPMDADVEAGGSSATVPPRSAAAEERPSYYICLARDAFRQRHHPRASAAAAARVPVPVPVPAAADTAAGVSHGRRAAQEEEEAKEKIFMRNLPCACARAGALLVHLQCFQLVCTPPHAGTTVPRAARGGLAALRSQRWHAFSRP